jgi:hypothetical protein
MEKFKIGQYVTSVKDIVFTNGKVHKKDDILEVNKENIDYFNVNHEDYLLTSRQLKEEVVIDFIDWLMHNKEYYGDMWYDTENPNSKDVLNSLTPHFPQTTQELLNIYLKRNE